MHDYVHPSLRADVIFSLMLAILRMFQFRLELIGIAIGPCWGETLVIDAHSLDPFILCVVEEANY